MQIILKSKSTKGDEALKKLMQEKSFGVASRSLINSEPYTVQIVPKGLNKVLSALRMNPYIIPTIEAPMINMMKDYGAKEKDYEISVVM